MYFITFWGYCIARFLFRFGQTSYSWWIRTLQKKIEHTIQLIAREFTPAYFLNWWNKSMGMPNQDIFFARVLTCIAHTGFVYRKNTWNWCLTEKHSCAKCSKLCVSLVGWYISRGHALESEAGETVHEGIRTKYLSARLFSFLMHEGSNEPTIINHPMLLSLRLSTWVWMDAHPFAWNMSCTDANA